MARGHDNLPWHNYAASGALLAGINDLKVDEWGRVGKSSTFMAFSWSISPRNRQVRARATVQQTTPYFKQNPSPERLLGDGEHLIDVSDRTRKQSNVCKQTEGVRAF
jgi:hypothetical protein